MIKLTQKEARKKYPYMVRADGDYTIELCENEEEANASLCSWIEENPNAYIEDSESVLGESVGAVGDEDFVDSNGNYIEIV